MKENYFSKEEIKDFIENNFSDKDEKNILVDRIINGYTYEKLAKKYWQLEGTVDFRDIVRKFNKKFLKRGGRRMTLIDGDRIITAQLYDDEHEEFTEKKMSIIDYINAYTDEGVTTADVVEQTDGDLISRQTANKININEYVKVKLTDYGKEIFYHQFDEINSFYKCEKIKPHYPKVDKEGYTSFQLWHFMNLYGNYIDICMQNVIEPLEIVFESAEKTAEWKLVDAYRGLYTCSNCRLQASKYAFCPNCGARMKGSGEE